MIGRYYGKVFSLEKLRELTEIGKEGVNLLGISDAAEKIGFQTTGLQLSFTKLMEDAPKPTILHWGQNHFIILLPQNKIFFSNLFSSNKYNKITIADPAKGIITIDRQLFLNKWISDKNEDGEQTGIALLLEPGQDFYKAEYSNDFKETTTNYTNQLLGYIRPHKKLVAQLFLGVAGVQRFMVGQIGMGILYLFTGGLCLIGTIIDTINHKKLAFEFNQQMARESMAMVHSFQ